jgi:hypothetical protein
MWIWGFYYFYSHSRWQWSREVASRKLLCCHIWNASTVAFSGVLWLISLCFLYLKIPSVEWWDDWCTGLNLEGSGRGMIKVLSRWLPGGTEESTKIHSQDIRCSIWDSKSASPEYKGRAIRLGRLARWMSAAVIEVNSLDTMLSTLAVHESSLNEHTVALFVLIFSLRYAAWTLQSHSKL